VTASTTTTTRPAPHDLDAEESLLGAMLLSRDAIAVALECCVAEDFYKSTHGYVFAAAASLYARGEPADPVTVADELRRTGLLDAVGDASVLISLQVATPSTRNGAHYARIVADFARRRRMIVAGQDVVEAAYRGESEAVEAARRTLQELGDRSDSVDLLRRWTMSELLAEPDAFSWLIRGWLVDPTYGQIGGELKTLKSTLACFLAVATASGVSAFGQFQIDKARPVLAYVGEGGRVLWRRRMQRIAEAMSVRLGDLPVHPVFDVAPIASATFQETLARDLRQIEPGLVILDPYYAYHGAQIKASDLHQEGALLTQLSNPCMDAGATLQVVNHFNQTGSGVSLKRITMAGSGEWSDSWTLLAHRQNPDVASGRFRLSVEIGSRQWGGSTWELDLDIGRFDEDLGMHEGAISWDLRRASPGSATTDKRTGPAAKTRGAILDALAEQPWRLTKTELRKTVGGGHDTFTTALGALVAEGAVGDNRVRRTEAGIEKTRSVWGLVETRPDESRMGCESEDS
jgi:hypothetical protein